MIKEYIFVVSFSRLTHQVKHRLIPGCHPKGTITDAQEGVCKWGVDMRKLLQDSPCLQGIASKGFSKPEVLSLQFQSNWQLFLSRSGAVRFRVHMNFQTSAISCKNPPHNLPHVICGEKGIHILQDNYYM